MYYRAKCLQNGNYMGWGYNSKSLKELCSSYLDYKNNDWDELETEDYYRSLPTRQVIILIKGDEFKIEKSKTKFDEEMPYGGPFSGKDNPPHFVEFSPQRKELRKLWNELKEVDWEKFLYDAEQYNNAYKDCYPDQGDAPLELIVKQITQ